jgi:hypothetical protein
MIYEDIMTADLRNHYIPVTVEGETLAENNNSAWIGLMQQEFASLKGVLFGESGQGGIFPEIKAALEKLDRGQDQLEDQISCMANTQIRDKAEIEARIAEVKTDLEKIGSIARGARDGLADHLKDVKERARFNWTRASLVIGWSLAAGSFLWQLAKVIP